MISGNPHIPFQASIRPENLYIWRGPSLLITDPNGVVTGKGLSGFFFRGTRFLRTLNFRINGIHPYFCSCFVNFPDSMDFAYIYPEVKKGGTGGSGSGMIERSDGILERNIGIRKKYIVRSSFFECRLEIVNCWEEEVHFTLEWDFDADFATIDKAVSGEKELRSSAETVISRESINIKSRSPFQGMSSEIRVTGDGFWQSGREKLKADFVLGRQEKITTGISVTAVDHDDPVSLSGSKEREQVLHNWLSGLCRIETPQSCFGEVVNHSVSTVGYASLLDGTREEWLSPAAGYPLYPYLFARDALTSAWMISMFDEGQMAFNTLSAIARLQGKVDDPERDEQPGRIIQQARKNTFSRLGEEPFGRYYGDFSSPFMYIVAFAFAHAWSGDSAQVKKIWPVCRRVLDWAERLGDRDGDGYLEYLTLSRSGPRNQAWKDSENAIVDENGKLVDPPVTTSETQGYYYASLQAGAFFSFITGDHRDALKYLKKAAMLKKAFNRDFWVESEGYIALGLDSKKKQIKSRTSNMGHCLATGIIDSEKVPSVVKTLFSSDMYSGWCVRTLSSSHPAYNPLDYHLGSIWPVENASIAFGLRRYGFDQEALKLIKSNFELALHWKNNWVPECAGGYDRSQQLHPGAFPKANVPQTWNAAAFGLFTNVLLGFQPFAPLNTLFIDPVLPEWLPELNLHSLRFNGSVFDLHVYRIGSGKTKFKVLNKKGRFFLIRQQPYNSLSVNLWSRLLLAAGITS